MTFKRENRYIVIKRADLEAVPVHRQHHALAVADVLASYAEEGRALRGKAEPLQAVIVEDTWGCYEQVWRLVEAEASCQQPQDLQGLADRATPGPWDWASDESAGQLAVHCVRRDEDDKWLAEEHAVATFGTPNWGWQDEEQRKRDAEYIAAADPQTILALLRDAQKYRAMVTGTCPYCGEDLIGPTPNEVEPPADYCHPEAHHHAD